MDAVQREQIRELYMEMFDKLMVYARNSLDNEALAEEAVQETFCIACQRFEKLCGSGNPKGWLVLTLRNTVRNMKRNRATAKKVMEQYLVAQIKEISFSEDKIDLQILRKDIADMDEFKLLWEMAIEGRSHQEMAASRGITITACKKRVQRAKDTLQRKIEK